MTRAELLAAVRESLPTRSRRADVDVAFAVADVVLAAIEAEVMKPLAKDWAGGEVAAVFARVRGNGPGRALAALRTHERGSGRGR
jgi:hypothetical protein